jgi:hypothetical protein
MSGYMCGACKQKGASLLPLEEGREIDRARRSF